jgi:Flp pilus assembly protein TadG
MGSIKQFARRCGGERGAELVEFALTLPLLMFVLLGVIEFGFVFHEYEVVTNAAREGARLAVLPSGYDDTAIKARVNAYLTAAGLTALAAGKITVGAATVSAPIGGGLCVTTRTVSAVYAHDIAFVGGFATLLGGTIDPINLTGTSTMRTETAGSGC